MFWLTVSPLRSDFAIIFQIFPILQIFLNQNALEIFQESLEKFVENFGRFSLELRSYYGKLLNPLDAKEAFSHLVAVVDE